MPLHLPHLHTALQTACPNPPSSFPRHFAARNSEDSKSARESVEIGSRSCAPACPDRSVNRWFDHSFSEYSMIAVSGWSISWAAPATNWPSEASFSRCTRWLCKPLLVFEAAPRIFQQMDQGLILKVLAHENEDAQHQHRCQYGKKAESPRLSQRIVPARRPTVPTVARKESPASPGEVSSRPMCHPPGRERLPASSRAQSEWLPPSNLRSRSTEYRRDYRSSTPFGERQSHPRNPLHRRRRAQLAVIRFR